MPVSSRMWLAHSSRSPGNRAGAKIVKGDIGPHSDICVAEISSRTFPTIFQGFDLEGVAVLACDESNNLPSLRGKVCGHLRPVGLLGPVAFRFIFSIMYSAVMLFKLAYSPRPLYPDARIVA